MKYLNLGFVVPNGEWVLMSSLFLCCCSVHKVFEEKETPDRQGVTILNRARHQQTECNWALQPIRFCSSFSISWNTQFGIFVCGIDDIWIYIYIHDTYVLYNSYIRIQTTITAAEVCFLNFWSVELGSLSRCFWHVLHILNGEAVKSMKSRYWTNYHNMVLTAA